MMGLWYEGVRFLKELSLSAPIMNFSENTLFYQGTSYVMPYIQLRASFL